MGVGQIADVNVVPHRRAIARIVVLTEDPEPFAQTQSGLDGERNRLGLGMVPLSNTALFIGARGVEIAKTSERKPAYRE